MLAIAPSLPRSAVPLLLSIAGRAGHAFEAHAMLRGFECHARGVEVTASSPTRVRARVRSKRVYDVELDAERGRLVAACSCPARSMGVNVCKHVWAALLEVDRHGGLEELRKTRGSLEVIAAPLPEPAPEKTTAPATKKTAEEKKAPETKPSARVPPKTAKKKTTEEEKDPTKTKAEAKASTRVAAKNSKKKAEEEEKAPSKTKTKASTRVAATKKRL